MKVRAETRPLGEALAGGRDGATVTVEPLLTGTMTCSRAFLEQAGRLATLRMLGLGTSRSKWLTIPIPAYLIRHPGAGAFLVDCGLHASVASKPVENLGRIMGAKTANPVVEPGEDLPAQLRSRNVDPKRLKLVVMTHLHFDHSSGMSQFPGATFVISELEWIAATTDSRPFLRGYRPVHYDYAFDYRTLSYDTDAISSYATFGRTFDLFGDGSVRLASTPGHSAGHQSLICRLRDRDLVIAGDAIYTIGQLGAAPEPPRPLDRHNWRRSMRELQHFARTYPQAVILPGHDPEHWKTLEKRYE
jgi:glyoxylase-like metal-dependent hydrolase (beta-lactamase superfamily II)